MTALEIELAVAKYIGIRQHLIVPNVSWGMGFAHECDLLSISSTGYATEIEIKISKTDILRDQKKRKWTWGAYSKYSDCYIQSFNIIKALYFAIPESLKECILNIPERAGVLLIDDNGLCFEERKPTINTRARKLTDKEMIHMGRLAAMRIWTLKRKMRVMK